MTDNMASTAGTPQLKQIDDEEAAWVCKKDKAKIDEIEALMMENSAW